MLPVYFLPEAEAELYDSQDLYDSRSPGLGDRFFAAVDALLPRIGDNPQQFPVAFQNLRRAIVRRFPYAIYPRRGRRCICHRLRLHQPRPATLATPDIAQTPEMWGNRLRHGHDSSV